MPNWFKTTGTILATVAAVGFLAASAQAATNCGLTGKWKMTGNLDGPTFATVVDCSITIAKTGTYTGLCNSYTTGQPATLNGSASGTIKANSACKLSGTLKAPNLVDTIVRGGMVSNDHQLAVVIGSRGTSPNNPPQVRFLVLMKE